MGSGGWLGAAAILAGAGVAGALGCALVAGLGSYQGGSSGGDAGWCQLNAPAGAQFCDDFDEEDALTPHWNAVNPFAALVSLDTEVWSSPPRSLRVQSDAGPTQNAVEICYNALLGDGGPASFLVGFDVNVDQATEQASAGLARVEIVGPPFYRANLGLGSAGGLLFEQEYEAPDAALDDKAFVPSNVQIPAGQWSRIVYKVVLEADGGHAEVGLADAGAPGSTNLQALDPTGTIRVCIAQHAQGLGVMHFDNVTMLVGGS